MSKEAYVMQTYPTSSVLLTARWYTLSELKDIIALMEQINEKAKALAEEQPK